jgi:fumarylacetoacetase
MSYEINETHDPSLKSWVSSANSPDSDFPIQNLPFGVFARGAGELPRAGIAIGDQILVLTECERAGFLNELDPATTQACLSPSLNTLMALGQHSWTALRLRLSRLLRADAPEIQRNPERAERLLVPMSSAQMLLPAVIGDYTDFYTSIYHATNVGRIFGSPKALPDNYNYIPLGYHGRASSIIASGTPVRRPSGQFRANEILAPAFGPSEQLDYELEVGFFVGPGNPAGEQIRIDQAEEHIFGLCLVNDWSARDIQLWEYQPLGPFLSKSFATTISPWVVSLEALAPYRVPAFARSADHLLPYLHSAGDRDRGSIDLVVEVFFRSERMRRERIPPVRLSKGNFRDMYWTMAQMLTHHTSNGCNLRPGDLIASGTVSGASKESRACLLELTWQATEPVRLPGGEFLEFLRAADEVIFRGHCSKDGFARIGFGECTGVVYFHGLH